MSLPHASALGCVVLAGGRGRRLGRDKASFVFEGVPLLTRVLENLRGVCAPIVVSARVGQTLPSLPDGVRVVEDDVVDKGPLAGIARGLEVLAPVSASAFVVATDMPFVCGAFVRALASRLGEHDAISIVREGVAQPIGAIYSTRVSRAARALLSQPTASPRMLLEQVSTIRVSVEELWSDAELARTDPNERALEDIDTEADASRLSRR